MTLSLLPSIMSSEKEGMENIFFFTFLNPVQFGLAFSAINKKLSNFEMLREAKHKSHHFTRGRLFCLRLSLFFPLETFFSKMGKKKDIIYRNSLSSDSIYIASEASYVYILSGKNAKNVPFWRVFENLKLAVKQCYQTGQFKRTKIVGKCQN